MYIAYREDVENSRGEIESTKCILRIPLPCSRDSAFHKRTLENSFPGNMHGFSTESPFEGENIPELLANYE